MKWFIIDRSLLLIAGLAIIWALYFGIYSEGAHATNATGICFGIFLATMIVVSIFTWSDKKPFDDRRTLSGLVWAGVTAFIVSMVASFLSVSMWGSYLVASVIFTIVYVWDAIRVFRKYLRAQKEMAEHADKMTDEEVEPS